MTRRIVSACMLAACVAACSSTGNAPADTNIFPKDYRKQITDLLSTSLEDPTNLRETVITEPARTSSGLYFVCLKYNGRDAERRYKGIEERVAYFHEGLLNQMVPPPNDICAKAAYQPFPEAQKLCLVSRCD